MTLNEAIAAADAIKPNAFSSADKVRLINEVEGMVQTEVFLFASEQVITYTTDDLVPAGKITLLVAPPHDKLYVAYLVAMIDFMNNEYDKYQNTVAMFNAHYREFKKWFALNYRPQFTHEKTYRNEREVNTDEL